MLRSRAALATFLLMVSAALGAQGLLSPELATRLETEKEIVVTGDAADGLSLLPDSPILRSLRGDMAVLEPDMVVEILSRQSLPASIAGAPDADLLLYRKLQGISRMRGLEYYSASRKAMRLLFKESYLVAEKGSRAALPDPLAAAPLPASAAFVCFQEDLSFGKNYYRLEYRYAPGAILLSYRNLGPMSYGPVKAVGPGGLSRHIAGLRDGDSIILYGVVGARISSALGLERLLMDKARESFRNRLAAVRGWYLRELQEE